MSRNVLVVEDEWMMQSILRDNLEFEGYAVTTVASGEQALLAAIRTPFDLVLLDVMLPGMSGYHVCRDLRANGFRPPVVMISARNSPEDRKQGFVAGADEYIGKPFDIRELIRLLARYAPAAPGDTSSRTI